MFEILSSVQEFASLRAKVDNSLDSTDKLTSKVNVLIYIVALIICTMEKLSGDPLYCFFNAEFVGTGQYTDYLLMSCYLHNTRYVPPGVNSYDVANSHAITYYQWFPFILIFLIALSIFPWVVWKSIQSNLDVSLARLSELAQDHNITADEKGRQKSITNMVSHINQYLVNNPHGNRFALTYIGTKFLNIVCQIVAIVFLCIIFGRGYLFFFFQFMYKLIVQNSISHRIFPTEVFCDFSILSQNNNAEGNSYTYHCLLATNLFSIFIFAFINIMQLMVLVFTIINFFFVLSKMSYKGRRAYFEGLTRGTEYAQKIEPTVAYLSRDGYLLLRLLENNTTMPVTVEVVAKICLIVERTQMDMNEMDDGDQTDNENVLPAPQNENGSIRTGSSPSPESPVRIMNP